MPRYHFNLEDPNLSVDHQGAELADAKAAKCHAITMVGERMCAAPHRFWEADIYRVTVADEHDVKLFTVEIVATTVQTVRKAMVSAAGGGMRR